MSMGPSVQTYETPLVFMRAVRKRFGPIHFDLAASAENCKAADFFSEADNSLVQDWRRVGPTAWLNPPFKKIQPWAERCKYSTGWSSAFTLEKILFHVPAAVGSNWFRDNVDGQALVLFLNGRITYVGQKDPYPKDMLLCVYGEEPGYEVWDWRK